MSIAYNKLKCIEICVEKYEVTNHLNHIFKILIFWYWLLDSYYTVYANSIFLCSSFTPWTWYGFSSNTSNTSMFVQMSRFVASFCKSSNRMKLVFSSSSKKEGEWPNWRTPQQGGRKSSPKSLWAPPRTRSHYFLTS